VTTAATTGPASPPADRALRRERFGWYSYDWAMSVFNTSVTTVFLGPYLTSVAEEAAGPDGRLGFLGLDIPPGSWFSYVLSASVLLQVLVLPLTGAVADRTGRKREMLAGFAALGALATTALYFVADGRYLLGGVLFILANISFGAATVVYYSWLPDLAGPDERDTVSSRGWAFGYVGGALLLAVHLGLVLGAPSLGRPPARRCGSAWRPPACGGARSRSSPSPGCATGRSGRCPAGRAAASASSPRRCARCGPSR
jgi:UMF1 family MFS transporter